MRKIGVGVIGCGVISRAYMTAMQRFPQIELRAVADMRTAPAEARGKEFNIPAMRVDQLLKRDDVEIVVNLTVPLAHTDVSRAVLNAGKHVHSEKPLGVDVAEARKLMELAEQKKMAYSTSRLTHQTYRVRLGRLWRNMARCAHIQLGIEYELKLMRATHMGGFPGRSGRNSVSLSDSG